MGTSATAGRRPLVSITAVEAATGLDVKTVRGHLDRGEWPGVRIGKRKVWRVPAVVIDYLLSGRDPAELRGEVPRG